MTLELQVYERSLSADKKQWQQKIIGHIILNGSTRIFRFGRNMQTREYIQRIDSYIFLPEEEGRFSGEGGEYIFIPKGSSGVSLRKYFKIWLIDFGQKETMLENNVPLRVEEGDQYVARDKSGKKEIVILVTRIY